MSTFGQDGTANPNLASLDVVDEMEELYDSFGNLNDDNNLDNDNINAFEEKRDDYSHFDHSNENLHSVNLNVVPEPPRIPTLYRNPLEFICRDFKGQKNTTIVHTVTILSDTVPGFKAQVWDIVRRYVKREIRASMGEGDFLNLEKLNFISTLIFYMRPINVLRMD
jgi:hypothetical protein